MDKMFLIFLTLVTNINADFVTDHCKSKDLPLSGQGFIHYFCHPTRSRDYIMCEDTQYGLIGHERSCPIGEAFNLNLQVCKNTSLSDCALLIGKGVRDGVRLCEAHQGWAAQQAEVAFDAPKQAILNTIENICHDQDPYAFVECPKNASKAKVLQCYGALAFSQKEGRCVPVDRADCVNMIPAASNMRGPWYQPSYPYNPTSQSYKPFNPALPYSNSGPSINKAPVQTKQCRKKYIMHKEKMGWLNANSICQLLPGGSLATIKTETDQTIISSKYPDINDFWIGLNDFDRDGEFKWVTGESLTFARWAALNPSQDYPNDEDCVTFNFCHRPNKLCWRGYWGDTDCSIPKSFLCQMLICGEK